MLALARVGNTHEIAAGGVVVLRWGALDNTLLSYRKRKHRPSIASARVGLRQIRRPFVLQMSARSAISWIVSMCQEIESGPSMLCEDDGGRECWALAQQVQRLPATRVSPHSIDERIIHPGDCVMSHPSSR